MRAPYPPALRDVIRHAERLKGLLIDRERSVYPFDAGGPWLTGRSGEVQCVVALLTMDWHEGRASTATTITEIGRYLRDVHDGLAIHLDIGMPSCCHPPRRAGTSESLVRPRATL
ncbi:MAG: hypothetical protein ACREJ3_02580 [Polyangiaceae bacterium]